MSLYFKGKINIFYYNRGMILKNFPALEHDEDSAFLSPELIADFLEKTQRIDALTQTVELKSEVIVSLKKRIQILEEALRLAKIKRFAPSSEQTGQASLFDDAEVEATINFEKATDETVDDVDFIDECDEVETPEASQPKPKTGRKPFAKQFPRLSENRNRSEGKLYSNYFLRGQLGFAAMYRRFLSTIYMRYATTSLF